MSDTSLKGSIHSGGGRELVKTNLIFDNGSKIEGCDEDTRFLD